MTIAECPTPLLAEEAARDRGMVTVMGAPNVVKGGSHSGNLSAIELARVGLLDVLASDYVPVSMLAAALRLAELGVGLSLPEARSVERRVGKECVSTCRARWSP